MILPNRCVCFLFRERGDSSADAVIISDRSQIGAHEGVGVFIWATDSHEDQVIEADEPRLAFMSSELTANGSVAST